jgi:uncharacterized membrane protein YkvA (DUF1232 family)
MRRVGRLLRAANAARLGTYLLALWKLFKHPDTPRAVKWIAIAVLAYAVSPIDLIPDFIPVIGLLDDLILIPLGLALVKRLTPPLLWQARLAEAEAGADKLPRLWWGALAIVAIWVVIVVLFALWLLEVVGNNL